MKPGSKTRRALVLALVSAALVTGGCGRKGGLEPPGAVERPPMEPATVIGGVAGAKGVPEASPPPKRPFLLDALI